VKIMFQTLPTLFREIGSTVRRRTAKSVDFMMHRERHIAGANEVLHKQ